jgi:Tfp pilus assembly protein PilF
MTAVVGLKSEVFRDQLKKFTVDQAVSLSQSMLAAGKPKKAYDLVWNCLSNDPKNVKLLTLAGMACRELDDYSKAISFYKNALLHTGADPVLFGFLADSLNFLKRYDEAIYYSEKAIKIDDKLASSYLHLSTALIEKDRLDEADECLDKALAVKPNFGAALINKGLVAHSKLNLKKALFYFDQVIEENGIEGKVEWGDVQLAKWNKSHILLSQGDFERGLPLFELRKKHPRKSSRPRRFREPVWLGDASLDNKTLLVHSEGGFGDTIQFIRYVSMLPESCNVLIQCQPHLQTLFADSFPNASVFNVSDKLPSFDFQVPVMSLPLAFGTRLKTIPHDVPYLKTVHKNLPFGYGSYSSSSRKLLGVVSKGSSTFANDSRRSVSLSAIMNSLPPGYSYVLLHKDISLEERQIIKGHSNIIAPCEDFNTFSETASLVETLDGLISVDTAVAHLAGALGVKTLLMLPHRPDWRWGLTGSITPWYPNTTIIRQASPESWSEVFEQLPKKINEMMQS